MKVAHITTVDGSLRFLLLNQMKEIREAGFRVIGVSSAGSNVAHIESEGIPHHDVAITRRITPFRDLVSIVALIRVLRREQVDIVHTHTPKPGLLGQIAARLAGVPIIVNTLHGFYFTENTPRLKRWMFIALERLAATCSDKILSQNPEDVATAIRLSIAPERKMEVLGNGIDICRFDPTQIAADAKDALRKELGIGDGPVIGFVGRHVREKGLLELLEALSIVKTSFPTVQLLSIGRMDNDRGDVIDQRISAELGVDDRVKFLGLRNDIPELLSLMNVLALPSHREGFPRAPMEAAAMGVPSIVTDIRGCRQTVRHEETGLIVPLKDPPALAAALEKLLSNPSLAQQLGRQARELAQVEFDERRVFQRVLDSYDELIRRKGLDFDPQT